MAPYEEYLNKIAQGITIRDEDRKVYTQDFDKIRDHIFNGMCKVDPVFNQIYKGPNLFGSYGNNVRIKSPSEFDVIFNLTIPFSSEIDVKKDNERPGFINLDFQRVLKRMLQSNGQNNLYNRFYGLVDHNNNYLRRTNLQDWLEEVMMECLRRYGDSVCGHMNDTYKLIYSKRGLAHTIYAKCEKRAISIDLVPGIRFGQAEWIEIKQSAKFADKCTDWYAVPKPTSGGPKATECYTFLICNPKVEHDLLWDKDNLKVVYRLLKSLRDPYKLDRIKSYFFTTAFLWEIEKMDNQFWSSPLHVILEHMLKSLVDYFSQRNLPFFWNRHLNLLKILDDAEINTYSSKLQQAYHTLRQYKNEPYLTFDQCQKHFKMT
ncbi:cyclic GMP-AMP synthase-like protein [Eurosta solidaginis]|uniref:cyclic GMP-AMP synthase-like protein n=1 Tax=Eurosta solidaginis TaxID=178769 RepID=UPI0035314776